MKPQITSILCSNIVPGQNDRTRFDPDELQQLADSIAENGLGQPITVRPVPGPIDSTVQRYEIVAGERRFRAVSKVLKLKRIDCIIRIYTDEQASAMMLLENVQRVDLNPIEEANAYQSRIDKFNWDAERVARSAKKRIRHVEKRLALLKLVPEAQKLIADNQMSAQFGEVLAPLDSNRQRIALHYVVNSKHPLLRELQAIVNRLLEEQLQESMFDINLWTVQTIEQECARHRTNLERGLPTVELPEMQRLSGIGVTLETFVLDLLKQPEHEQAGKVVATVYQRLIDMGMCYPPR